MSTEKDPAAAQAAPGVSVSSQQQDSAATTTTGARRVSPRKAAANRANARYSTGPRTVAGKARVRMNAVRHGLASQAPLLPGEDPDELAALARAYDADLRPRGALERDLVARIVGLTWRLRRVARAEEAIWARQDHDIVERAESGVQFCQQFGFPPLPGTAEGPVAPMTGAEFAAGQFDRSTASALERLAVYEQRLDRALHAAVRELRVVRDLRGSVMDFGDDDEHAVPPPGASGDLTVGEGAGDRAPDPPAPAPQAAAAETSASAHPCEPPIAAARAVPDDPRTATGAGEGITSDTAMPGEAPARHPDAAVPHIPQNEPTGRPLWTRTPTGLQRT